MGIKGWLTIGAGLLISAVCLIRKLQEEDQREKKLNRIIHAVDCGEPEESETVEKMTDDIKQAFRDLELDEEADAFADATDAICEMVQKEILETTGKTTQEILSETVMEDGETAQNWLDRNFENIEQKLLDEQEEERRLEQIRNAVESKNFTQMYNLFEQRYNKYPVQMSRGEAFGKARDEGLITEDILKEAHERYGKLWNYVGD